jgi:hypothetical protein
LCLLSEWTVWRNVHRLDEWRVALKSAFGRSPGSAKAGNDTVPM